MTSPLQSAAALMLAAGCAAQPSGQMVCTMEARSSFVVTVVDSLSGVNLAPSAAVRVVEVARPDSIVDLLPSGRVYSGALYEMPGTYSVMVTQGGYAPWRVDGVQVETDQCHVITESLTARLHRTG